MQYDNDLHGLDNDIANVFDADAGGDDRLFGYGGDDTYWLGYGTDHDTINRIRQQQRRCQRCHQTQGRYRDE